ncbi:MAG TPA: S-adenosylmethionine:tRNA ribosyltransferase-isomerase, partial [Phycisphaerae bacterium]|nr:S-adenosylmethionine:tRNA ribosyltransferase-isomerase [Phycisphaerae bacterium]
MAAHPCEPRDAARLMVIHRSTGQIEHRHFRDIVEYLRPADCLILNRTKVLPAKFFARRRTGGRLEGLFISEASPGTWRIMLKGAGRLRDDEVIELEAGYRLTLVRRLERGECEMRLEPAAPAMEALARIGSMPLPP